MELMNIIELNTKNYKQLNNILIDKGLGNYLIFYNKKNYKQFQSQKEAYDYMENNSNMKENDICEYYDLNYVLKDIYPSLLPLGVADNTCINVRANLKVKINSTTYHPCGNIMFMIDTGASISSIPLDNIIQILGGHPLIVGNMSVGVGTGPTVFPTTWAYIDLATNVESTHTHEYKVLVLLNGLSTFIIGRDILKYYYISLDFETGAIFHKKSHNVN